MKKPDVWAEKDWETQRKRVCGAQHAGTRLDRIFWRQREAEFKGVDGDAQSTAVAFARNANDRLVIAPGALKAA
ncbi:hypothetical protein [Klebsiella pneumoniae]|uniref:hypothetical protein n=1 Tax=Klebsiella pneumoniae TaxID=573 RepID=UPI00388D0052